MNDPRITDVLDANNLSGIGESDVLSAALQILTGDPGIWDSLEVDLLRQVFSKTLVLHRDGPPTDTERIANTSLTYIDNMNGNTYLSNAGEPWRFVGSKAGIRQQVYIANLTQYTGGGVTTDVGINEYYPLSQAVYIGATPNSDLDDILSDVKTNDVLFAGSERFNITQSTRTVINNKVVFFYGGRWESTFADITFGTTQSFYYNRVRCFIYETIWSGYVNSNTPTTTTFNLNAGKKFSDYELLTFHYGGTERVKYATMPSHLFTLAEFGNANRQIVVEKESDTSWHRLGGNGSDLRGITGIKTEI